MDKSRGTPAPSTLDFSPDASGRNMQGDFSDAQTGSHMRRLECDMGLPQGFLAIHERPGRQEQRRERETQYESRQQHEPRQQHRSQQQEYRPAPAPYYPEQQYRQQYQTAPTMPGRYRVPQNSYEYQQGSTDQRWQQQQYTDQNYRIDPRYQQQYQQQQYMDQRYRIDPRYQQQYQQQQYTDQNYRIDPRYQQQYQQQQYMDQRYRIDPRYQQYQQQQYTDQRYRIDPRYQQYTDPRYQQEQQYRPQYQLNPQGYRPGIRFSGQGYSGGYDSCNQNSYCQPAGGNVIYRNGYAYPADYNSQMYDQNDPAGRYIPGRNPQQNWYRQEWWRQAQNPSGAYDRLPYQQPYQVDQNQYYDNQYQYQNRYPNQNQYDSRYPNQNQYDSRNQNQYDNRYPDQNQYDNQYRNQLDQQTQYQNDQIQRMTPVIQSMLGHSIMDFDASIPERLGCARAVSVLLEKTYGLPIRDQGCEQLERTIQNYGWVQVDAKNIQPGDVIIGHRQAGDYGHAAVYVGNDMIYNNNSNTRKIQIESANKFAAREFVSVNVYRKAR